jgi:hypothetical protein
VRQVGELTTFATSALVRRWSAIHQCSVARNSSGSRAIASRRGCRPHARPPSVDAPAAPNQSARAIASGSTAPTARTPLARHAASAAAASHGSLRRVAAMTIASIDHVASATKGTSVMKVKLRTT